MRSLRALDPTRVTVRSPACHARRRVFGLHWHSLAACPNVSSAVLMDARVPSGVRLQGCGRLQLSGNQAAGLGNLVCADHGYQLVQLGGKVFVHIRPPLPAASSGSAAQPSLFRRLARLRHSAAAAACGYTTTRLHRVRLACTPPWPICRSPFDHPCAR